MQNSHCLVGCAVAALLLSAGCRREDRRFQEAPEGNRSHFGIGTGQRAGPTTPAALCGRCLGDQRGSTAFLSDELRRLSRPRGWGWHGAAADGF